MHFYDTWMQAPALIVCEKTGTWAVSLKREADGRGVRIRETRSIAECCDELKSRPGSFVALEVTPTNLDAGIAFLGRAKSAFGTARCATMSPRVLGCYESLFREAGAIAVTFTPRDVTSILDVAKRHLDQNDLQPDWREQILAQLPWG